MKAKNILTLEDKRKLVQMGFETAGYAMTEYKNTWYKEFGKFYTIILNPFTDDGQGTIVINFYNSYCAYGEEINECTDAGEIYTELAKLMKEGIIYEE